MTQHVSLDLESLGKGPQAMILAIGAVKFDPYTGVLAENPFYRVIDIEDPGGGVIDASTVVWWMRQSRDAQQAIFGEGVERVPLTQALIEFSEWLGFNDSLPEDQDYPDVYLWERGDKDCQWLISAYEGTGFKPPFAHNQYGCQRTFTKWSGAAAPAFEGIAHNALDDAIYQARALHLAFKHLGIQPV